VPTEHSWTELRRGLGDLRALLAFRSAGLTDRVRLRLRIAAGVVLGLTVSAIVVPAYLQDPLEARHVGQFVAILPSFYLGFLALAALASIASGGGREVVPREQAVAFPISSVTEHFGALLLAPLNIAWLIQAWILLGSVSYATPHDSLAEAQVVMLLWLAFSTAAGQVVAWAVEAVRRGPHGVWLTRGLLVALGLTAGGVQLTGHTTDVLDRVPTVWFFGGATAGLSWRWALTVLVLVAASVVAIIVGAVPAHLAAKRMPHDEARMETDQHQPRAVPRSVLGILIRTDRASIWRSVPMRRGVMVLAIGPGLVAVFGDLPWSSMTILPGLVASGGALLFGVNAWCLDGRGALWRENLPVSPTAMFDARAWVLFEFLAIASLITVGIGALRAGVPNAQELSALVCTLLVVHVQVVAAGLRWSIKHPYPVDLRSARATPAPPAAMVGYSARLATSTTITSLFFSGTAHVPDWRLSLFVALPCLVWSGLRVARARDRWADAGVRARVVSTVAA